MQASNSLNVLLRIELIVVLAPTGTWSIAETRVILSWRKAPRFMGATVSYEVLRVEIVCLLLSVM